MERDGHIREIVPSSRGSCSTPVLLLFPLLSSFLHIFPCPIKQSLASKPVSDPFHPRYTIRLKFHCSPSGARTWFVKQSDVTRAPTIEARCQRHGLATQMPTRVISKFTSRAWSNIQSSYDTGGLTAWLRRSKSLGQVGEFGCGGTVAGLEHQGIWPRSPKDADFSFL